MIEGGDDRQPCFLIAFFWCSVFTTWSRDAKYDHDWKSILSLSCVNISCVNQQKVLEVSLP